MTFLCIVEPTEIYTMDPEYHVELYFSYALMFFALPSFSSQSVANLVIFFFRAKHVSYEKFISKESIVFRNQCNRGIISFIT